MRYFGFLFLVRRSGKKKKGVEGLFSTGKKKRGVEGLFFLPLLHRNDTDT